MRRNPTILWTGASIVVLMIACIGILAAAYMPNDWPLRLVDVESNPGWSDQVNTVAPVISPDGAHVYLNMEYHLVGYRRERKSGRLQRIQEINGNLGQRSTASTFSPNGQILFVAATHLGEPDVVRSYRRDPNSGLLTHVPVQRRRILKQVSNLNHMICSPDGKHLYVTSRTENGLFFFSPTDSGVAELEQVFQDKNSNRSFATYAESDVEKKSPLRYHIDAPWIPGATVVEGIFKANALELSHDGRILYVATGMGLAIFQRDPQSGRLTLQETVEAPGSRWSLAQAQQLEFSPDGRFLYCGGISLIVMAQDAATGKLSFRSYADHNDDRVQDILDIMTMAISKSGRFIFAATPGSSTRPGRIAIFERNAASGRTSSLKTLQHPELHGVTNIALSPDGRHLYAATRNQTLLTFTVDDKTGLAN